ncbi:helix-hairpin-helix domain-containing protein [Staphylococcus equorum]|uniref:Helix-hairpin-helix domain-containing protein n=1 Tax=Staphylococcus equorum TaxID=246432 RepID=A0A9X4R002_9STAP|nr:helix-hairpin-helix domain-containing protein [Staphylococcus equorum]MDG0842587.1 helix-hairpin-helix domain-containing protein [Staphylococcus equorum]MDG0858282.1 helix-hairpin-helix domain-containing protein [Staphylococcus equorum]
MLDQWNYLREIICKYKAVAIAIVMLAVIFIAWLLQSTFTNDNNHNIVNSNDDITTASQTQQDTSANHTKNNTEQPKKIKTEDIFVDIKGAVQHPDIYKMKSSDRIKQLLDKAIVTDDADLSKINLAEKLVDQKLVYIPKKDETINSNQQRNENINNGSHKSTSSSSTRVSDNSTNQEKININNATETELLTVPGIGPSKAKSIIEYREQNGAFESIEQLTEVKGIGAKTFEKLGSYFTI